MTEPPLDLLARSESRIGELVLRRRVPQAEPSKSFVELLIDGRVLMSGYNDLSERALARRGVERCAGDGLRVLVGGLGLGHTAHEALAAPRVAAVDVVELVPEILEWFEVGLIPLAEEMRDDPRLRLVPGDVYGQLLRAPDARHDLILIDVDHAPHDTIGDASASFYTAEGLRRVARHLHPGGVLGVWSYADNPDFVAALREVFATVHVETTLFEDDLFGEDDETNWLFFATDVRPAEA